MNICYRRLIITLQQIQLATIIVSGIDFEYGWKDIYVKDKKNSPTDSILCESVIRYVYGLLVN